MNVLTVNSESRLIPTKTAAGVAVAGQKLSVSTNVLQFAAFDPRTKVVLVSIDTNDVRVRFDGTDPDATTGNYYAAKTMEYWNVERAKAAKFIQVSGGGVVFGTELTY